MSPLSQSITAASEAARVGITLVACDFDGVLSDIAATPDEARADPACLAALDRLSRRVGMHVAVVSGRGRAELARYVGGLPGVLLVGSHGLEGAFEDAASMTTAERREYDRLESALNAAAGGVPGLLLERKPFGLALHYRRAEQQAATRIIPLIRAQVAAGLAGVYVLAGKMVVEFSVRPRDKAGSIEVIRRRTGASTVIFLGDDETDEDVFRTLRPTDISVKVGEGATAAAYRVDSVREVAELLGAIGDERRRVEQTDGPAAIDRHLLLSDQRALALTDDLGRVVWMCAPRPDSPPLFSSLVAGRAGGSFDAGPATGGAAAEHAFDPHTFLARTRWDSLTLTDYLDCSAGRAYQRAGRSDLVRVIEGRGRVRIRFAPRPDFGRTPVQLRVRANGVELLGVQDPVVLYAPGLAWQIVKEDRQDTAVAETELSDPAHPLVLELRCGGASLHAASLREPDRRHQTAQFWSVWSGSLTAPPEYRDAVLRSALVLKALAHGPSGAILAAATTSLPETPGGGRNWDYRYCWPRDAAFAASALTRLGNTGHAMKLADWMLAVLDRLDSPDRLRPIYTVTGGNLGPEGEIGELPGYLDSRPVRVSNGAAQQVQLDVFGPVAEMVALMAERGAAISPEHWRLIEAMVTAVHKRWREPDHGIWELRSEPRHHVHSRVMCWVTVDRALRVSKEYFGHEQPGWERLRDAIRADLLAHGFNQRRGAFTTAYGSDDLDAAALTVGLSGLLTPDDPWFISTVAAVERELRDGPTVRRYRFDDGLPGIEGGFYLCAFWLVESYAMMGRRAEAKEFMRDVLATLGPTGLLAEEWCPRTGIALGNFPQAYSHAALINAAVSLGETTR